MSGKEAIPLDRPSTEEPTLKQAIAFTSSVISLSHSIKAFSGKWNSIRNKLEELLSDLSAFDNCEVSSENLSISIASESILATLKSCDGLARSCLDFSFSGKLRMQSDLDVLSAKLEIHISRISGIYSAGLLVHSSAVVLSPPSASASRDELRFYTNDLLSRMRIGGGDRKKLALIALNEAIQENERYAKVSVEIDGLIEFVVNLIDSRDCGIHLEAVKFVWLIAGFEACRGALISAGAVAPLIRVLELGNFACKQLSARCLMKFTENSENGWAVSAHGGVSALLKICGNVSVHGSDLIPLACGVLKNLAGVEEIARFMVEEGAISVLIELVGCKDEMVLMSCVELLQTLACRDESFREMIIKGGGIVALVSVLDPTASVSVKAREVAFKGITNIYSSTDNSQIFLADSTFSNHILYFLQYGELPAQELALKAAFLLCGTSEEVKKVMGDMGFMPALIKFLDSKSIDVCILAGETLCSLMTVPKNLKRFLQSEQSIGVLLHMLDPEAGDSGNKKVVVSVLMSLTSSSSGRKKIVKSIEKLAEGEVLEAKMMVRKLSCSRNRFRGLLSFWHS